MDRSRLSAPRDLLVYFSLPDSHKGNRLTLYGGFLRYKINYKGAGSRAINGPDVIVVVSSVYDVFNEITVCDKS